MKKQQILEVELSKIQENPYQPRKVFGKEELEELAQSIQSVGILHPPIVRQVDEDRYELIAGERRFRAAKLAGLKRIPVLLKQKSGDFSAEAALIENLQRVDLNPLDIAKALRRLIIEFGLKQEALADKIGKKRSTIANYLRLLTLPYKIQESLAAAEITMGHAKALLSVAGLEERLFLHKRVVEQRLSVRETEEVAEGNKNPLIKRKVRKSLANNVHLREIEEKLQAKLGTKVAIAFKGNRGKISIDCYSLDDLERVLEVIG